MKKHFLIFTISCCFGISHAFAQSRATTGQEQAAVITDTVSKSGNSPRGTISKAGKNQQSVYTPPASNAGNNAPASGTPASPAKEQPATIDPKK